MGRGISGSPLSKESFILQQYTYTHASSRFLRATLSCTHCSAACLTFSDIQMEEPLKISLQTQVVSHLITLQICCKSRFPCFLYSHVTEVQHLCCVCGKGRQRPAVSLPCQDGLIVIPGSIVCQNSLGQDRGLSCQGSPAETCRQKEC